MRKITIFTDLHVFAPHELKSCIGCKIDENCYDLGDNVDIRNCKSKDINSVLLFLDYMNQLFIGRQVSGNHELDYSFAPKYLKVGSNTLLTHGDELFWGKERSKRYRDLEPASGNFLKHAWIWLIFKQLSKYFSIGVGNQFEQNCVNKANQFQVNHIICSHIHPLKRITKFYYGKLGIVKVTILPRGNSEVEIDD